MISLSEDTRHFLRNPHSSAPRGSDEIPQDNGRGENGDFPRNAAMKKTLKELALDHSNSSSSLTHAGSCPSLFDPLANRDDAEDCLQKCSALEKTRPNGANENLLKHWGKAHAQTKCDDPFLELITKRHNLKLDGLNLAHSSSRNENTTKGPWLSNFE